jgi:hypothetical protein
MLLFLEQGWEMCKLMMFNQGFYNPVNDSLLEPTHTGFSYSFTADGYYEEAYYRVVSNRTLCSKTNKHTSFE